MNPTLVVSLFAVVMAVCELSAAIMFVVAINELRKLLREIRLGKGEIAPY